MCRLFGMSGGREPVKATFWLLEAPDSLDEQSRREPDGTGIGTYADGKPRIDKQPQPAFEDSGFQREAHELTSTTFVAHVRYASNGGLTLQNTHPFEQQGRIYAHNGVIGGIEELERELGPEAMSEVHGDTDSERFFALITREIERTKDVQEGIVAAANWVADNLPVLSINFVLSTAKELWALRYPDSHELHMLERDAGGQTGDRGLSHRSTRGKGRIQVAAQAMSERPAVVVATEPMDDDPGWRQLKSGELLHVGPNLKVDRQTIIDHPPVHPLTLEDLEPKAAESQRESKS